MSKTSNINKVEPYPVPNGGGFSNQDMIDSGHCRLFLPDSPQMPIDQMLMVDTVPEISRDGGDYGKGHIIGKLPITPDLWFFKCHFFGDPVMPGCLGLDAIWQLAGFYMSWQGYIGKGRALGAGKVSFAGQVTPDVEAITMEVHIKKISEVLFPRILADGKLLIDGKPAYKMENLSVAILPR